MPAPFLLAFLRSDVRREGAVTRCLSGQTDSGSFGRRRTAICQLVPARPRSMPGIRRPRARRRNRRARPKPGARPLELIAELLQRHPLQRLLNGTTVTASPRQRQRTRRAPGQAAERQGHQLRIQTRGNAEPFSRGIGDRSPIRPRDDQRQRLPAVTFAAGRFLWGPPRRSALPFSVRAGP